MYKQSAENQICESKFGIDKNVLILTVFLAKNKSKTTMKDVNSFVYGKPVQLKLHKQYLKLLLPENYEVKQHFIKEYDILRNKNEERSNS